MILKDEVAVITGGGCGIGLAVAQVFAKEGAKVAINDLNAELANKAAQEIRASGGDAIAIPGDVSDVKQVQSNVREVMDHYGRIDILFNNAGIYMACPAELVKVEDWRKVISVNLDGIFFWAQAVGQASMIPNRYGKIINTSSMAGFAAPQNVISYVSSKHAVVGLTKSLALEWGKYNIRVNCLCPGMTITPLVRKTQKSEVLASREKRVPLRRLCNPEEQANAVLFLASEQSSFVNGLIMNVDGGMLSAFSGNET